MSVKGAPGVLEERMQVLSVKLIKMSSNQKAIIWKLKDSTINVVSDNEEYTFYVQSKSMTIPLYPVPLQLVW